MKRLCTYQCNEIVFDVWDGERVPVGTTSSPYFITPTRLAAIEMWKIQNKITEKLGAPEQLALFIDNGWLEKY
jgi:hypothetical protein